MSKTNINAAGLRPLYSFDQLVIGPNNHVASAACHEVISKPGEVYNPLFIYGPSGVGKTHLIQATAHEILRQDPQLKIRYISAERFVSEILMAISEDKVLDLRKEYSQLDLLIIDDVQYLSESKMSQDELFHIFNNLHEMNKQVILAADRPPNQLTALNKNIRSRLEWGLSADVTIPDEATRLEILRKKQEIQGVHLNHDMLTYVARMLHSNVRELEGFLKRIHAYVTLSHQEVNQELVQAVLKEILPEGVLEMAEDPVPVRTVDKPRPAKAAPPPPAATAPPAPFTKEKKSDPAAAASSSEPERESSDLVLDSIDLTSEPPEQTGSKSNGASRIDPVKETPPPPENGKNGHHKPARPPREPAEQSPHDFSLPAPSHPPSAPSNLSFDLLLESMSIATPEAAPKNSPSAPEKEAPPPGKTPPPAAKATPAPATPPAPAKSAVRVPPSAVDAVPDVPEGDGGDDLPNGHKEVGVVFFYPEGCKEALQTVQKKFQEVIKKHKLKFRMKLVHNEPYSFKGKINYSSFVDVCKANKVPVAVVIGPPPDTFIPEQDFYDLLTVTLDVQGVSLQLVNWGEISKDYRYLNLALDIALVRAR